MKTASTHLKHNEINRVYLNREISWLDFNDRVLHEAFDPRNPLIERLKFLAIFSSNLDEFFMVRVSGIHEQIAQDVDPHNPDGMSPQELISLIRQRLRLRVEEQHRLFQDRLRQELRAQGACLLDAAELSGEQYAEADRYFTDRVFPILTPLSVDASHPFPRMANLSLNLAVIVEDPDTAIQRFARVKIPDTLPRFIPLAPAGTHASPPKTIWAGIPLEQLVARNLAALFPGMRIVAHHLFRITRDADFPIKEEEADDLLQAVEEEISKRRVDGFVCRVEIDPAMPAGLRDQLLRDLGVGVEDVFEIHGFMNLKDLFFFASLPLPDLKFPEWAPVTPPRIRCAIAAHADSPGNADSLGLYEEIRRGDILVHHPYESFAQSVEAFICQAADDPAVMAIKMTLYRTSGDSPIIQTLIRAAENQKQVVVLVEVLARFDEANNIVWAKKLEQAGVHVVYGVIGLKTHTKTTLIVRREDDRLKCYVHIGTGNYNSKTARLYTDLGLFSCRDELGSDLSHLFNYLTGYSRENEYQKLLVAPFTLRSGMEGLIRREMAIASQGGKAHLVAKMNSLTDIDMINLLYEASQAGVKIQLIVRGVCCLIPGLTGISENISVISLIGRYLEHSRIYYFLNAGNAELFIGSADWMTRNLDRRVEAVTPIDDPDLKAELKMLLDIMLEDNRQAWELQTDGSWRQRSPGSAMDELATQTRLMQLAASRDQAIMQPLAADPVQTDASNAGATTEGKGAVSATA